MNNANIQLDAAVNVVEAMHRRASARPRTQVRCTSPVAEWHVASG